MPTTPGHGSRRGEERKLPKQQLAILAICRFAEPLASTSLFPYLPEMIRSFNIPDEEIGKWTGICAASFSFFQALMGIPWGRASDRYGRKPAILIGLTITMITSLMWGFSTSMPMAIAARAIAGAGNGNVGIIRTTVAEMVPYKELQPQAFSIMPLVWNLGSIFGPSIGGTLANPLNVRPHHRPMSGSLLEKYPYALPNLVSAAFFMIGITTGVLFLEETLSTRKHQRDWGLVLGRKLVSAVRMFFRKARSLRSINLPQHAEEREPFIRSESDQEHHAGLAKKKPVDYAPPPWSEVLTRQAVFNLIVYWLLAMHTMAYDGVLPVLMADKPRLNEPGLHLKFHGGFGLTHTQIGMLNTGYGIFSMVVQFFLFPPIARRLGILYCMKWCAVVFPITYFLTPFSLLMPTRWSQVLVCYVIQLLKGTCAIFAFPCSAILLTNSASSLRTLGTVNGIATAISALGRAGGPFIVGMLYSEGYRQGYAILPWWTLAVFGVLGALPVWALVESDGFANDADDEQEEEHIIEDTDASLLETGAVVEDSEVVSGKTKSRMLTAGPPR